MSRRKRKLNVKIIVFGIVAIAAVAAILIFGGGKEKNYYDFTSCMADSGLIEIGSDSCLHCENQKKILGHDAFKKGYDERGMYLRCNKDPLFCANLGIKGTPTWYMPSSSGKAIDAKGKMFTLKGTYDEYLGEISIEKLSKITGCAIPEGYDASVAVEEGGFTGG